MKRIAFALLFVVPAIMVACGQSNNNDTTASTPLTTQCLQNPSLCQNSQYGYGYYQQYGFYQYPQTNYYYYQSTSYNYQVNSCACSNYYGYGFIAVYSNYGGAGCASPYAQQTYAPYAGMLGWYSLGASNTQWVNIGQVSNIPNASSNSCNQTAQACYPQLGNNGGCGSGYACSANGSPIGLCVKQ